jgi:hypothetical protein
MLTGGESANSPPALESSGVAPGGIGGSVSLFSEGIDMASSPVKSKDKSFYRETAKILKNYGVISYPDIRNLSPQQKGWITRRAAEYAEIIAHPDAFHIAKVKPKTAETLKASGYKASATNKVFIPLKSAESPGAQYDSAKIRQGKIIFKGGKITETVTPATAANFHGKLSELANKKLKNNQMLTVKIGDNASFNSRFQSYADLYKYLTKEFKPNPGKNGKKITGKSLMRYMSIVEVETSAKKFTTTESQKNARPTRDSGERQRAKKEKNTKQNLTRK